jgi:hypothetical protein
MWGCEAPKSVLRLRGCESLQLEGALSPMALTRNVALRPIETLVGNRRVASFIREAVENELRRREKADQ